MSKFNFDVLFLILEKLQDDDSFHSLLLVNKTWSEVVVPILWKNPWKYLGEEKESLLLDVIISHLSDKTKNNFKLTSSYKKPLFDYVGCCKHLDLCRLEDIIYDNFEEEMIKDEIFRLFINENTRITHLYIRSGFSYQINLIPGVEICLSELEFLYCNTTTDDDVLVGLSKVCKSIKELNLYVNLFVTTNNGIVELIENQKKLNNVRFQYNLADRRTIKNNSFRKTLEKTLIKHANNIQHFSSNKHPITNILSSFANLKSLEIDEILFNVTLNNLENVSLPCLRILRVKNTPFHILSGLFKNAKGLHEIKVEIIRESDIETLIQSIHENCPNLKYLGIPFKNDCVSELEKLLVKCKCMEGLYIRHASRVKETDWKELFKILAKSSPNSLYKFKFQSNWEITLESFKIFFYHWKGRRPMLLQTIKMRGLKDEHFFLFETNEFVDVIKKYRNDKDGQTFEDFEWIKPIKTVITSPWLDFF